MRGYRYVEPFLAEAVRLIYPDEEYADYFRITMEEYGWMLDRINDPSIPDRKRRIHRWRYDYPRSNNSGLDNFGLDFLSRTLSSILGEKKYSKGLRSTPINTSRLTLMNTLRSTPIKTSRSPSISKTPSKTQVKRLSADEITELKDNLAIATACFESLLNEEETTAVFSLRVRKHMEIDDINDKLRQQESMADEDKPILKLGSHSKPQRSGPYPDATDDEESVKGESDDDVKIVPEFKTEVKDEEEEDKKWIKDEDSDDSDNHNKPAFIKKYAERKKLQTPRKHLLGLPPKSFSIYKKRKTETESVSSEIPTPAPTPVPSQIQTQTLIAMTMTTLLT
jgi:hypothetical protein